ncbi:MAG: UDP-N-acetylmuramate dehydrogenase [Candidatus Parcubacteria bacterium]
MTGDRKEGSDNEVVAPFFSIWYHAAMELQKVSLKDYSSLRVGGEGELVRVTTVEELREAITHARSHGKRVHVLGGGTNSYFGEDLSAFLFIKLALLGKTLGDNGELELGASEVWDDVVMWAVEQGLWGIENLSYIPGTVGAAPVQNIGAYGVELKDVFVSLSALDISTLELVSFDREACRFGYRDSVFKYKDGMYIITEVKLALSKSPRPVLLYKPLDTLTEAHDLTPQTVRDLVISTRQAKLPDWYDHPNAGSFFKNPIVDEETSEYLATQYEAMPLIEVEEGYKIPAGWLIEHVAHMKGVRTGDLGTWPAQALVIVNYGEATADDVDAFAEDIRSVVREKTGILLEQEVNRVG